MEVRGTAGSKVILLDKGLSQKTLAHRMQNLKYIAGLVSLVTFVVYLISLKNGFVNWDDPNYVSENLHISFLSPVFVKWAFFSFYASNWHPLTWISHAFDYAIWGLNPLGHHLTNNILHAINTFLVVILVARLLGIWKEREGVKSFSDERAILITAGVTGLLFGLHPLHVESVVWVAERKDLLCGLFFLLSLLSYMTYMSYRSYRTYLFSLLFFILALLSKPMAVSLPFVLLILDRYPFKRIHSLKTFWTASLEKLPFIVLSLISSILTILAQRAGGAMRLMEEVPFSIRMLVAARSLFAYLWKMILPVNLIPYYPYPDDVSLSNPEYLSFVVLAVILTTAFAFIAKKQKIFLSVWFYYIFTLLPVLGIIQVGGQSMADRYTYLPALGPFLIVGVGAAWVLEKAGTLKRRALMVRVLVIGIAIMTSLSLTYLTSQQIKLWKSSLDLWDYVIGKEPGKVPLAHYNRGFAFDEIGRLDKAIEDYNKALDLNPSYIEAYINRGMALNKIGQFDKAIADFDKVITLNSSFYKAYINKGMVYGQIGSFYKAIEEFSKAVAIMPDFLAYSNRGLAYYLIGEYERSLADLNTAIELNNAYPEAYGTRGNVYLKTGYRELAISDFRKACDLGDNKGCEALNLHIK